MQRKSFEKFDNLPMNAEWFVVCNAYNPTLTPYEEVYLVSQLPQFIHLILKNLFFTLIDI